MKPSSKKHPASSIQHPTYYIFYRTNYGVGAVIFTDKGVAGLIFPSNREKVIRQILDKAPQAVLEKDSWLEFGRALSDYFQGKKVKFNFPFDLTGNSSFEKNTFSITRRIPYGSTRSYRWVAERLEKPGACRAVGNALGRNPVPIIIPCHRVVRGDGNLGGFSAGVGWKKRLLELEKRGQKTEDEQLVLTSDI